MDQERKLAVAIDETMIGMAEVDATGQLGPVRQWPIGRFSTLTDALLAYEKEAGGRLHDTTCAIGVFGATQGESIPLARGSWAISRAGLRAMFGRDAIIINDVAARAWAVLGGRRATLESLSPLPGTFRFDQRGRWALTNINNGVGLAVIDVDAGGRARVLECEMGHCGFAAVTDEDRALAAAVVPASTGFATWEMVLTVRPDDESIWSQPGLPRVAANRADLLARLMGRYVGDVVLAHGAWSGALVTGKRFGDVVSGAAVAAFNASFENKPKFGRLMRNAPRARVKGDALTLHGCAAALAHLA